MRSFFLSILFHPWCLEAQQRSVQDINDALGRGINLGNMFEAPTEEEWGNPFRDEYLPMIAGLGFQHVRIPIRWDTPERTLQSTPFTIELSFFERIRHVVDRALAEDLMVIINMHHHDDLFSHPLENKEKFLTQWEQIAAYFSDYPDNLLFEILNEPHGELTPGLWNSFSREALGKIRTTNPHRVVLFGTADYGGVSGIFELDPPDDPNIIVTVHYYNPFQFTHQGADWVGDESEAWLGTSWHDLQWEREAIIQELNALVNFSEERGIPIHMGEFGAFQEADMDSRKRWTTFIARHFESMGFSWAYWEWSAGFGIYDPSSDSYISELVDALLHNPLPEPQEAYPVSVYDSDFSAGNDNWNLIAHEGANATLTRSDESLEVNTSQAGTEEWHVQLSREGIPLKQGNMYRLSIEVSASQARTFTYYIGKSTSPYNSYSGYQSGRALPEQTTSSHVFTMNEPDDANARIVLDLGNNDQGIVLHSVKLEELNLVISSIPRETPKKPRIYPNPFSDRITVEELEVNSQVQILTVAGQLVRQLTPSNHRLMVDLGDLPVGMYVVRVVGRGQQVAYRVIKK